MKGLASHPDEPHASFLATWGIVGWICVGFPFFSYRVYARGLGLTVLGIGKCYLPYKDITRITKGLWSYNIRHRNKEIRNPVCVPRKVGLMVVELQKTSEHAAE